MNKSYELDKDSVLKRIVVDVLFPLNFICVLRKWIMIYTHAFEFYFFCGGDESDLLDESVERDVAAGHYYLNWYFSYPRYTLFDISLVRPRLSYVCIDHY